MLSCTVPIGKQRGCADSSSGSSGGRRLAVTSCRTALTCAESVGAWHGATKARQPRPKLSSPRREALPAACSLLERLVKCSERLVRP